MPHGNRHERHHRRTWRQFFQFMGPGIVSGAADNDPSGVVTYIQVGATTGTGLLWLMLLSTPMLYYLEEMSTRLGGVNKRGIARILRSTYGPRIPAARAAPPPRVWVGLVGRFPRGPFVFHTHLRELPDDQPVPASAHPPVRAVHHH